MRRKSWIEKQSNSRRVKEIDGVAVSKGRVRESGINEINAEEDSGEKGGDGQRRKAGGETTERWREAAGGGWGRGEGRGRD